LEVNYSKDNIKMDCNSIQIFQVIVNLLHNSIDAISKLNDRWIKYDVGSDEGFVIIKVVDSGNGIDEELVEKIFHSFFTTKQSSKGTGLGLFISKQIAEEHFGDLQYYKGENTTFILRIPAA